MPNRFEVILHPNKFRLKPGIWVEPPGTTTEWPITTTTEEPDVQYVYYDDGIALWRKGVRDGCFVWDKALTPVGFNGIEDTDWENVRMLCGVGTTTTESPGLGFGLLYNYYAAVDGRGISNTGWHVPTEAELQTLSTYLGGDSISGGKLKETGIAYWAAPNTGATNEVGFNARAGGSRSSVNGTFEFINYMLAIISTTLYYVDMYRWTPIFYSHAVFQTSGNVTPFGSGNSIRLLKDTTTLSHGESSTYIGNDGKVYRTICIGTQEWLADNLAETKYRNGDPIPEVTNNAAWAALTSGALCAYNNDWNNV